MSKQTQQLSDLGVSIWLDDLSRERMDSGNLAELIEGFNVVGVTTNPTIFQQAISAGTGYAEAISEAASAGHGAEETVFSLMVDDVARACDMFRPLWESTAGVDGRVSIEVSPELAHDTQATIGQAQQLHQRVNRDNVLIKIPATKAGLPAITEALARGISVNVTLIFSLERYREVVDAFLSGIEAARANGHNISQIHSVASFFVSRVDTAADAKLDALGSQQAQSLRSRAGVANARLAYREFETLFATERARSLIDAGMNLQRPLWASTGVKDPALSPTLYVNELAVEHTVNTMPEKTLMAVAEMTTTPRQSVREHYEDSQAVLGELGSLGISYDELVEALESEGVAKFIDSWRDLLATVQRALDSSQ